MKRLTSYSPFALALAVVLALGALAVSMVSADVAGTAATADPTTPGAAAQYRITFTTPNELQANTDSITIRFDKDATVPATIDRSRIVVTADNLSGATGGAPGQAVTLGQDPTVSRLVGGEGEMEIKLTIPDMDPSTTAGAGSGIQNIAAGAVVSVTISSGAGVRNPTEGGGVDLWVFTSQDPNPVSVSGVSIPRRLTLSSIDGGRGTSVTVTGTGFKDGTTATVWLDTNGNLLRDTGEIDIGTAPVGADDTFAATITVSVPPFVGGTNSIMARDGRNNHATAPVTFTVLGSVTVTPREAALGDTITITLKDFPPSSPLPANAANLGGVALPIPGTAYPPTGATVPGTVPSTDANGEVTFATIVPNGVPTGTQALQFNNFGPSTRRTNMTIKGATITLTPDEVVPNQTVTLIGNGFTTSAVQANVILGSITIDGAAIPANKINEGNQVSVDAGGNWSTSVIIPITTTTTTGGNHELKVTDACSGAPATCNAGREGTVTLKIKPRTLTLDPAVSRLGTRVNVRGDGFPASNTKAGAEADSTVRIEYGIPGNPINVATLTPDASGNISGSFSVPLSASIPSTNTVTAFFNTTGGGTVTTTVTHSIPRASVTINPPSGPAGTSATITVAGFRNFTTVQNMTIGNVDVRPSPVPATGASGDFTTTITIPQLEIGTHTVEVRVGGTTASTSFSLTSSAPTTPGPGQGSVDVEVGLEPLGDNLVRVWGFDGENFMLYDPNAALLSDLETLQRGSGYWINVEEAQTVTLGAGTYNLRAGWNLIGWLG